MQFSPSSCYLPLSRLIIGLLGQLNQEGCVEGYIVRTEQ
jgi:hypothetical protein